MEIRIYVSTVYDDNDDDNTINDHKLDNDNDNAYDDDNANDDEDDDNI